MGTLYSGEKSIVAQAGTLDVDADSSGSATVELKTVATVATARVTASIKPLGDAAAIVRNLDVPFVGVNGDQVFTLTSSATSLPPVFLFFLQLFPFFDFFAGPAIS